jgi:hypothetical protein
MKKTLQILNRLVEIHIIEEYAIAGGMAQFYYVEPSITYDLDLVVNLGTAGNTLTPLAELYKWADENDYKTEGQHIILGGIPVQFLLPYNDLITEALKNRVKVSLFDEVTYIFSAEYLMAIMLQTWRPTDRERLVRFFNEADYNEKILNDILEKFKLLSQLTKFKERYAE